MPRRAHRRCKEQGPTCLGVTHPGFDICSRCLYDVVRPRMRAQKEATRMRKANRLSHANRSLISEVDLKEPQMAHAETDAYVWEDTTPPPTLTEVIQKMEIEREAEELIAKHDDPLDALHEVLVKSAAFNADPVVIPLYPLKEDSEPEMPTIQEAPPKRNSGKGGRVSKLSDEQWQEALDAYTSGMGTKEICEAWSVNIGSLYSRINRAGLPKRGQPNVPKTSPVVSPVQVAPAPTNGVVSGLTEWVVTYTVTRQEVVTVEAESFNDAAAIAAAGEAFPIDVRSVAKVNH